MGEAWADACGWWCGALMGERGEGVRWASGVGEGGLGEGCG